MGEYCFCRNVDSPASIELKEGKGTSITSYFFIILILFLNLFKQNRQTVGYYAIIIDLENFIESGDYEKIYIFNEFQCCCFSVGFPCKFSVNLKFFKIQSDCLLIKFFD